MREREREGGREGGREGVPLAACVVYIYFKRTEEEASLRVVGGREGGNECSVHDTQARERGREGGTEGKHFA